MGVRQTSGTLFILAFGCFLSRESAAEPLTVARALEIARQHNPELRAARQEAEIARGRLVKARYWNQFNPEIEGGATQRRFDGGGTDAQRTASASMRRSVTSTASKLKSPTLSDWCCRR
jgi:outer membrane protein TolC